MAATRKTVDEGPISIDIMQMEQGELRLRLKGTTPLICNRLSEKARRELLLPAGRKSSAEKQSTMKHNPLQEFRASPYTIKNDDAPTLIGIPIGSFKKAISSAALDMPGAFKAQIGRLTSIDGTEWRDLAPVWGEPQLLMAVTRMADAKRTPDVRSRAIISNWVSEITIRYVSPILRDQGVLNLVGAAGMYIGVGDWRSEKGAGNYGSFTIAERDDDEVAAVMQRWGRDAQIGAMESPQAYDQETEDLLAWFDTEAPRRGFKVA